MVNLPPDNQDLPVYVMSHYQRAGQKHSIQIANLSFEVAAKLKYLGTLTDQNCMHEEVKNRLSAGNACSHSVQGILSTHHA
jgi:hypothetical protein